MVQRQFDVYGTALSPHPTAGDPMTRITDLAVQAERYDVNGLLIFYNHQNLDPAAIAGVILERTATVTPLLALQPYALPPFSAAKLIHSLTMLHGRRIDINLITGATDGELGQIGETLNHDERYERAIEYITVVRALLSSKDPLVHDGRFYRYRALQMNSYLAPELRPRVFVAGSSPAARRAAEAVADIAVTHPEPVEQFQRTFMAAESGAMARERPLKTAIRVGLLGRETPEEAWRVAAELYPSDRQSQRKTLMRKKSESDWSRRLAMLATAEQTTYDEVYWTGAYRADKGSMPMLVGNYRQVADYLDRYLALGVETILLGGLLTEADFHHAQIVLADLRGRG